MIKRMWRAITEPNEIMFDDTTRWDMEKEYWAQLVHRYWWAPLGHLKCKLGIHSDFVDTFNKTAHCIWCRRATTEMPRWFVK